VTTPSSTNLPKPREQPYHSKPVAIDQQLRREATSIEIQHLFRVPWTMCLQSTPHSRSVSSCETKVIETAGTVGTVAAASKVLRADPVSGKEVFFDANMSRLIASRKSRTISATCTAARCCEMSSNVAGFSISFATWRRTESSASLDFGECIGYSPSGTIF
jgi:hypothetical protein